jgi:hypothetical protein
MKDGQTYLFPNGKSGHKKRKKFMLSAAGKLSSAALAKGSRTILVLSIGRYNKKCHSVGQQEVKALHMQIIRRIL